MLTTKYYYLPDRKEGKYFRDAHNLKDCALLQFRTPTTLQFEPWKQIPAKLPVWVSNRKINDWGQDLPEFDFAALMNTKDDGVIAVVGYVNCDAPDAFKDLYSMGLLKEDELGRLTEWLGVPDDVEIDKAFDNDETVGCFLVSQLEGLYGTSDVVPLEAIQAFKEIITERWAFYDPKPWLLNDEVPERNSVELCADFNEDTLLPTWFNEWYDMNGVDIDTILKEGWSGSYGAKAIRKGIPGAAVFYVANSIFLDNVYNTLKFTESNQINFPCWTNSNMDFYFQRQYHHEIKKFQEHHQWMIQQRDMPGATVFCHTDPENASCAWGIFVPFEDLSYAKLVDLHDEFSDLYKNYF